MWLQGYNRALYPAADGNAGVTALAWGFAPATGTEGATIRRGVKRADA